MGIEAQNSPIDAFRAYTEVVERIVYNRLKLALSMLGNECVNKIRNRKQEESWIDRTGNLRSSVGYAVFNRGKAEIMSKFETIKKGADGSEQGRKYVESLAHLYADTYSLVVVAGMSYAEYVEAIESQDVLASTEVWASKNLKKYIDAAMTGAKKDIANLKM
jgi:hypothetical protein